MESFERKMNLAITGAVKRFLKKYRNPLGSFNAYGYLKKTGRLIKKSGIDE